VEGEPQGRVRERVRDGVVAVVVGAGERNRDRRFCARAAGLALSLAADRQSVWTEMRRGRSADALLAGPSLERPRTVRLSGSSRPPARRYRSFTSRSLRVTSAPAALAAPCAHLEALLRPVALAARPAAPSSPLSSLSSRTLASPRQQSRQPTSSTTSAARRRASRCRPSRTSSSSSPTRRPCSSRSRSTRLWATSAGWASGGALQ